MNTKLKLLAFASIAFSFSAFANNNATNKVQANELLATAKIELSSAFLADVKSINNNIAQQVNQATTITLQQQQPITIAKLTVTDSVKAISAE